MGAKIYLIGSRTGPKQQKKSVLSLQHWGAGPRNASQFYYNEDMTQLAKVDLVGVGLNATDTLVAVASSRLAAPRLNIATVR